MLSKGWSIANINEIGLVKHLMQEFNKEFITNGKILNIYDEEALNPKKIIDAKNYNDHFDEKKYMKTYRYYFFSYA